jgi:uncharacterized protein YjbI with pentapeptide repeats
VPLSLRVARNSPKAKSCSLEPDFWLAFWNDFGLSSSTGSFTDNPGLIRCSKMDLPDFPSNELLGDLNNFFGCSEPTSADPKDLALVEQGVAPWNAWRHDGFVTNPNEMLFSHRPNLIGANLCGPKWDPNDLSRMIKKASELVESPAFKTAASDLRDRLDEYIKDEFSEDLLAEFPEAVQYFGSFAGTVNLERHLKSEALLEFYVQHSKSDLSRWFEPIWSIFTSRDLRSINFRNARLNNANLRGADLRGSDLSRADFRGADLSWADLSGAHLRGALLSGATLLGSTFVGADLRDTELSNTDLEGAKLRGANLTDATLTHSNLRDADLTGATMMRTNMENSILIGARVYGISIWDARLSGAIQTDVVVTPLGQPEITVDSIEVAQFIYLLINNARIRDAIDAISSKAVLVLGRFTPARKATLDALRVALRKKNCKKLFTDCVRLRKAQESRFH